MLLTVRIILYIAIHLVTAGGFFVHSRYFVKSESQSEWRDDEKERKKNKISLSVYNNSGNRLR